MCINWFKIWYKFKLKFYLDILYNSCMMEKKLFTKGTAVLHQTASDEPSERKAVMSPFFVTSRHNWTSRFLWRHRFLLRRTGKHRGIALLVFLHRQPRLGNVVIFVYDGIDVGFDLGDFRNRGSQDFRFRWTANFLL